MKSVAAVAPATGSAIPATALPWATPRETTLDDAAIKAFAEDRKVALVATLDEAGLPHLTLLTSLQARGPRELTFGQFCEGASKEHLHHDPRAAFLIMTGDRRIWTGKARWSHEAKKGEDHEAYNRKPMFRYNAYFGIHTVHYLDLLEVEGPTSVSAAGILAGVAATALLWRLARQRGGERILSAWAERHLASPKTLQFVAYVDIDGFPAIAALVPCRSAGSRRMIIARSARDQRLANVAAGSVCAVYGLNLQMESVMVRGRLSPWRRRFGLAFATLDIDHVYNSMPPNHGVVYPASPPSVRAGGG